MADKQDLRQTLEDILLDLRNYDPLLISLSQANASATGWGDGEWGDNGWGGIDPDVVNAIRLMNETNDPFEPVGGQSFDVVVVFGAITETTTPRNTGKTRSWRIQVNVGAKLGWRQEMDGTAGTFAVLEMADILGRVDDRMDRASGIRAAIPSGVEEIGGAATMPREDDDGSLTISSDWIINHTQITRRH